MATNPDFPTRTSEDGALHDAKGWTAVYVGWKADRSAGACAYVYGTDMAYINRTETKDTDGNRQTDLCLCNAYHTGGEERHERFAESWNYKETDEGIGLW